METSLLLKYFLPSEFLEHFDLVKIKEQEQEETLCIHLEEKNVLPEEHSDKPLESKGFGPVTTIQDFPIRDKRVLLKVRCRKWRDKLTGKTYSRSWDLSANGTNYTKEFAAFLKEFVR